MPADVQSVESTKSHAGLWRTMVFAVLLLAAVLRLWGIRHDLPFSFYGDELHMMKRAMAMGTGDLNPHWFHKPAFLMYLLLATYGSMYGIGRMVGWFDSAAQFGASFLHDHGPFLLAGRLVVVAFGVAAVFFTYRFARDAMQSRLAGVAAGVVAAVAPGLVESGQHIKSDVPCAALMMAALSVYWVARRARSTRGILLAGALSGVAMGTHYYAVILLPTYAAVEALAVWRREVRMREAVRLLALLGVAFGIGMFAVTPYTFLDPHGTATVNPDRDGVNFIPGTLAAPAPWWYPPVVHVLSVLVGAQAFGPLLSGVAVLGIVQLARQRKTETLAVALGVPVATFVVIAAGATGYQVEPRHLSPLYPLLAVAAWAGALAIAQRGRTAKPSVAVGVIVVCLVPSVVQTAASNREKARPDSRVVAYHWLMESLPRDGRVLLDDYGPQLPENPEAVRRLLSRLPEIPPGPFTLHQSQRLELLAKYPARDGFDVESLGHQWWLGRELSDAELRASAFHRDMGNPLISRVPRPLDQYRAEGFRWVVTNSEAADRYGPETSNFTNFPSFVAFYAALRDRARLVHEFDPATWNGKGPVIRVYALDPAAGH